jgi:hypothetical protein
MEILHQLDRNVVPEVWEDVRSGSAALVKLPEGASRGAAANQAIAELIARPFGYACAPEDAPEQQGGVPLWEEGVGPQELADGPGFFPRIVRALLHEDVGFERELTAEHMQALDTKTRQLLLLTDYMLRVAGDKRTSPRAAVLRRAMAFSLLSAVLSTRTEPIEPYIAPAACKLGRLLALHLGRTVTADEALDYEAQAIEVRQKAHLIYPFSKLFRRTYVS